MNITMKLPTKIETENAASVQANIDAQILDSGVTADKVDITLDADDLKYISSSGLRVVLSTKKRVNSLNIINASSEVCDIFNVTGFDEFIPISRKISEISIEGLKMVGIGSLSRVYRLDKEKVVKVYSEGTSYETVLKEQERSKKALSLGIDTTISYGVVKVGNCFGAVCELPEAKSILDFLKTDPDNADFYLEKFVDFVKKNNSIDLSAAKVPSIKKLFYDRIDKLTDTGFFSEDEAMTAKQIIYSIPDKETFVHGDCHFGNVMLSKDEKEMYFIDLPTLSKGNPIFDIFSMAWMREADKVLENSKLRSLVGAKPEILLKAWKKVLSYYFETQDDGIIEELDREYTSLECLNLSMAGTYAPNLFTRETLEWLKAEGLKSAEYEF